MAMVRVRPASANTMFAPALVWPVSQVVLCSLLWSRLIRHGEAPRHAGGHSTVSSNLVVQVNDVKFLTR